MKKYLKLHLRNLYVKCMVLKIVNDVRFHLFSGTFKFKIPKRPSEKHSEFLLSSLPPCTAELKQHLLRVRYVTKLWRNAHIKHPIFLSPVASGLDHQR